MSDTPETPPRLPKRVKKPSIKAFCPADLKNKQDREIAELDLASAMLTLDQLTCIIAGVEFGVETAALRLGWTVERVEEELRKPECAFTIKMARDMLFRDIVKAKVRALKKVSIGRKSIEERLMELAYMDPTETKGSIEGQVKALKVLGDLFGHAKEENPLAGKSTDELREMVRQGALVLEGKGTLQ